jgi:hypothetical protein
MDRPEAVERLTNRPKYFRRMATHNEKRATNKWIPEAARLLRPGGELIFLSNGLLLMLCTSHDKEDQDAAVTDHLQRDLFGVYRFDRSDGPVEFHLPHGEMIRLLRESGFEIERLIELQAPKGATTRYPYVTIEWTRRWPVEEVWKARKK